MEQENEKLDIAAVALSTDGKSMRYDSGVVYTKEESNTNEFVLSNTGDWNESMLPKELVEKLKALKSERERFKGNTEKTQIRKIIPKSRLEK